MTDEQKPLGDALQDQMSQSEFVAEIPYVVTEKEIEVLAEALAFGNNDSGFGPPTHEQLQSLVLWATGAKLAYMLFQEIMAGTLDVTVIDGEPVFAMHKTEPTEERYPEANGFEPGYEPTSPPPTEEEPDDDATELAN